MSRPSKKKQDKELVTPPILDKTVAEAPTPVKKINKNTRKELLLNYSKVTLKSRGLI